MSKAERRDSKGRQGQQQQKQEQRSSVRKNSGGEGQAWQLGELRERGKKVLRKLLPNQPMGMIKRLVQKGADNLKKEILANQRLLPALTAAKVQSSLVEAGHDRFHEMNKQLTHSLLFFHSNVTQNLENDTNAEVVRSQTDKCYRRIPRDFFEPQLSRAFISGLLTHDRRRALSARQQLCQHYDEVQFNVNQQVGYKMGVFLSFVSYLTSIGTLADLSIGKIQGTRGKNREIQQIVVQRAARVNALRARKEQVEQYIAALSRLKTMKRLEEVFMSQVQAKGRVTSLALYADYCGIHESLKRYCCPRMLCRYWDVAYYIERGYHDSFSRSLKNYLCEIIVLEQKQLIEVLSPSKAAFATVDSAKVSVMEGSLDESYEVEEEVELVCKHNIEREIVSTFKEGLNRCSYSTDEVCEQLRNQLAACENRLYMLLKGDASLDVKTVAVPERKHALERLTTGKYVRVAELWSERLKKVVRRQTSLVERALRATIELKREQPEKEEVVTSYLMQLIQVTFDAVDESLAFIVSGRKFKQQQTDSIRQVLIYEQQWKELVADLRHLPTLWHHLQRHFADERASDAQSRIVQELLGTLTGSRRKMVQLMIQSYNAKAVERLPAQLQDEDWKLIAIPARLYTVLGEVLYGQNQKSDHHLLSSSLLLERNSSTLSVSGEERREGEKRESVGSSNSRVCVFELVVGEREVSVEGESFRMIGSTLGVVEALQGYLEWVEEAGEGEKLECTVLSKIMEYLLMYNTHVKELILNKGALSFGKVRSKSITGKHLLIAYSQLKFFRTVGALITRRFPEYEELSGLMAGRLQSSMGEVSKKFRSILQLSIRQSVNRLVVDPRKEVSWPVPQSVEIVAALSRSGEYVREVLLGEGQLGQFVGVNWCAAYLQQLRGQYRSVYRQIMNSNGTRKSKDIDWTDNIYWKLKELQYLVQSLADLREHIPGFNVITDELELERKKLEHPQ